MSDHNDYEAEFARWWQQAVHPTMKPSAAATRTHVLFAQHMVLLELEAASQAAPAESRHD
jgi:hypothetical protein